MATSNLKQSKGLVFLRTLASFIPLILTVLLLVWGMFFIRAAQTSKNPLPQTITVVIALIWGVGGVILLFFTGDIVIEQLPVKWTRYLEPALFVGPALLMLTWALIIPTI